MKPWVKKTLWSILGITFVAAVGLGGFVYQQTSAFDAAMDRVYDVPVKNVQAPSTPETIARGDHLAHSLGGCALSDCHGEGLSGGKLLDMGPLGLLSGPNITSGALGAVYSDGELLRLVEHGLKKDGKSVLFMSSHEINWLPEADILAIIAYLRSLPSSNKPHGPRKVGTLAKILDQQDKIHLVIAHRINHEHIEKAPPPMPIADYGRHIGKLCMGCHGDTFGGGAIPGAPPEIPIPANITPDASGLQGWTYEEFERLADQGIRKDGKKVDPFMPIQVLANMDATERKALFAFLTHLPAKPFGSR